MVVSGSEREYNNTDSDMCGLFAQGVAHPGAKTTNGVKADGTGRVVRLSAFDAQKDTALV